MAFAILNCRYRNHVFCWNKNRERDFNCTSHTLACGLLLETFKFSSPGDTKMLVVVAIYVSNLVEESAILTAITLTAFHLLFFWIASVYRLIKILGFVGAIKDQFEHAASIFGAKLPKKEIQLIQSFPGACSILLGAIVYIAFTMYQNGGMLV